MRRRQLLCAAISMVLCAAILIVAVLVMARPANAQPGPNAQPSGGAVVAGTAAIARSATATTISQSTQRAAIDWQNFDIGSQQTVQFQPSSPSISAPSMATLNRVIGPNPSQIAGRIASPGQVIITNQSGVTFFRGAQINTAGLMVTAAGISNANFMAGRMVFDQPANPGAAVINEGHITVRDAGLAALVAPQVANTGVINARLGHVVLAGAQTATLDLYGDGLMAIDVTGQVVQAPGGGTALVTNTGLIRANGGTVQLTARAADGVVQNLVDAGGKVQANTIGGHTGTIVMNGVGGDITVAGQLSATGNAPGTAGGNIVINPSGTVAVAAGARIDASGQTDGGTIALGTTLARAAGGPDTPSLHTAANVVVAPSASIAANATGRGNGGRITLLSTQATVMDGSISATGGPQGGNGGFVETSGTHLLDVGPTASVTAAAPQGAPGQWLLDPDSNVLISDTGTPNVSCIRGICRPTSDSSILAPSVIDGDLNLGTSVTVTTSNANGTQAGNITVGQTAGGTDGEIQLTQAQTVSLTLDAGAGEGAGSIVINSPITDVGSGGALSLVLSAPNGNVTIANNLTLAGSLSATPGTASTINLGSGTGTTITTGAGQSYDGAVVLQAATSLVDTGRSGITFFGSVDGGQSLSVNAGIGRVNFIGPVGADTPLASLTAQSRTQLGSGVTTTGDQTYNGAVSVNGTQTLLSTDGSIAFNSTVDGAPADATFGLTVSTANGASFSGAVGGNTPLGTLAVTGPATLGADITTDGAQTYSDAVTLIAPVTLTTTDAAIEFDGQVTGGANSLTLTTNGGDATLSGVTTSGNLTLNTSSDGGPGTVTLDTGTYAIGGTVATDGSPNTFGAVITNGTITLGQATNFGAVTLGGATTIDSSGVNGAIDFTNTVDGGFALAVNAGSGGVTIGGAVGGDTPLASLLLSGTGQTTLDGNVTTVGSQTYDGPVQLGATLTLTDTNAAITLGGQVTGGANSLTLSSGTGSQTLSGVTTTGALTLTTTGTVTLDTGTYTVGTASQTFPAVTTNGTLTLGLATTFGAVTLGSATTMNGSGLIDFVGAVNGAFGLTVNPGTGAVADFIAAVGGTAPLASLTVNGQATLQNNVTTTGTQTYNGPVTVDGTETLAATAGSIDFGNTLMNGALTAPFDLTVSAANGTVTFGGAVGQNSQVGGVPLASLTVTGGTIVLDADATVSGVMALDSTGAGVPLAINTTLTATQIALTSAGPITEGANGVLDPTQLAIISPGPVSLTGANNVSDLAADITGAGNGFAFRDLLTDLAIDTVTLPSAAVSVTGITTNDGQIQIGTTSAGNIAVNAPISSGGAAIDLVAAPESTFTNSSAITSGGGNIVVLADQMSLSGGTISTGSTSVGTVVLGPATSTQPIVLGEASDAATLGLQSGDLDSITAGMVQVGYRAEDGTSSFTGDITIGGNAGITLSTANFPTLLLVTGGAGTIAQSEPISFPNGTLGAIADGNIALASGNSVGTVAGFTDGGLLDFANGEALTVGSLTLPTLGVAVDADGLATAAIIPNGNGLPSSPLSGATASGPLVIGTTGDLTLAANVTADGQMVTLGASNGSINQTAGIITAGTLNAAGSDNVALNDSNDITTLATGAAQGSFSLNNGTDLTISGSVAGLTSTTISAAGTLTVNGTVISNGGRVGLSGSSIDIAGGGEVSDGGTGTTTLTATDGTINETGTLLAGTLGGSATGAATLTGASPFSNQIATLASFSASNLTLTDGTALTIAGPVTADFLNITATGRMVLAGTINTTGASLLQQSGPSPAPQGSTLQVVDSPLDPSAGAQFIQTGTVTLGDPPATTLRVQLPASGGSATFNDLLGSGAELVLALGNGTATGAMQVGGLLVIGQGGSTTLTGSIDGVITGAAAALGQISPAVNASYTFNGCIIGLATCGLPPGTSPGTPGGTTPPTRESLSFLQLTAVLGGLIDFLPGPRLPPLPTLPKLNVVLLPTLPVIGNQLAPQDVVPPNISFEDY